MSRSISYAILVNDSFNGIPNHFFVRSIVIYFISNILTFLSIQFTTLLLLILYLLSLAFPAVCKPKYIYTAHLFVYSVAVFRYRASFLSYVLL